MKNEGRISSHLLMRMILISALSCLLPVYIFATPLVTDPIADGQTESVRNLLQRLIPEKADLFRIEVDLHFDQNDAFQIESANGRVLITGNKGYAAAAGVYHYLKYFCGCHVSWSGNQIRLPDVLPMPPEPVKITFLDKYRYYQNVCTSSYSYVWWTWKRWEKEIDWMALNGINLPLAFTAQEAIWTEVFKKYNFTDHDIDLFYTGPAFLAWNRMGNIQTWVGPLSNNWHRNQVNLQHKILDRLRSFGMTPVLPAFSGRVVPGFARLYPNASVTVLNKSWGHFEAPFGFVSFLQPTDPLFKEIGADFLRTYIEEFGTNHFYNADLFNEMPPPSNSTRYLRSCSKSVFKTITSVDPNATWIIQGWMFYSDPDIWKPAQAKSFLRAVPKGRMIVLDLQSELYPQYHRLNSYYGQSFIWCMLHNYGGVMGLYGSVSSISQGPIEGRNFGNSTMIGTGLTPEGIETNDVVYELMNEMSWRDQPVDLDEWVKDFIHRRYGVRSSMLEEAWIHLTCIQRISSLPKPWKIYSHTETIFVPKTIYVLHKEIPLPKLYCAMRGELDIILKALHNSLVVWYDVEDVYKAWSQFVNASQQAMIAQSQLFKHDLVDVTRQSLQLIMDEYYDNMRRAFRAKELLEFRNASRLILDLFQDLEELLSSDKHFLLGVWLNSAKNMATNPLEERQYEYNARNQITLWGPDGQILDYSNKQWAGLMSNYYQKRWALFLKTLDESLMNGTSFNQTNFNQEVYELVEYPFNLGEEIYDILPRGDPIEICERLLRKYKCCI